MASLAINPNFTQQGSRPLPLHFGYALESGDAMIPYVCTDGSELQYIAFGDGEYDGIEQSCFSATGYLASTRLRPLLTTPAVDAIIPIVDTYFHNGRWTPIGIPNAPTSTGPDQGVDSLFGNIPTVTPPQFFSNFAYAAVRAPVISGGLLSRLGYTSTTPLQFFGIVRGTRCRYFDADGNVTGYGFTTNPVWHRVEMYLRFKFKKQQPQIAGLTAAEKACFDWASIVALAARNDVVLANGAKRFTGNYVFAANATLTPMLETSMRCDRSYVDDQDGKIGMFGHDAADPSFALTGDHIVPGSFTCEKKDLTNAPNVFIPVFRDLNIQALVPVETATVTNAGGLTDGYQSLTSGFWGAWFTTGGQNPFPGSAVFFYGDGDNPALNHDYVTTNSPPVADTTPAISAWAPGDLSVTPAVSNGGFIGTQTSRFGQRSPNTVQHSRHQKAAAMVAPGVPPLANVKEVRYDLGNMSYDQANRLMQYAMNSTLGLNEDGWVAPFEGTFKVIGEEVDVNGNSFDRMRPYEQKGTFTIDDTVSPELVAKGITKLMITALTNIPPSAKEPLGAVLVEYVQAPPDEAYPDTSYTPDASLQTIASAALKYVNSSLQMTNVAWLLQATASTCTPDSGSTITVAIPDLTMQILGRIGFSFYPTAKWTGLTPGTPTLLYVDDPGGGTAPTFGWLTGVTDLPGGSPATRYMVYVGSFTAGSACLTDSGMGAAFTVNTDEIDGTGGAGLLIGGPPPDYYEVTGITVTAGGSGYTTPSGYLLGTAYPGGGGTTAYTRTDPVTLTVVGGAITAVTGFALGIRWAAPPTLVVV